MYRIEALKAQQHKLHGDVFFAQPVSLTVITGLIVAILATIVLLMVIGTYARTEHVKGHLVPSKGLVRIQTGQYGSLEKLLVKEGDQVKEGDILAVIKLSQTTIYGLSPVEQSLQALALQEESLDAQIGLEHNQLDTDISRLNSEQTETLANIISLKQRIVLQREITASTQKAYEDVQTLVSKGFISKLEFERLYQTWLVQQAEEKRLQQALVETQAEAEQFTIKLAQVSNQNEQRLARLRSQKAEISQRKVDVEDKRANVISAPVNGKVVAISNASIGRSVMPGQALLTLLPEGSELEAELFVPSSAVGFIEVNQEVRLLYDAFPYQRFGSYPAVITQVTQTILSPDEALAPFPLQQAVYRVTAAIKTDTVEARGNQIALQSGMTLKANIVLERRTFLEWLLEPLRALGGRS